MCDDPTYQEAAANTPKWYNPETSFTSVRRRRGNHFVIYEPMTFLEEGEVEDIYTEQWVKTGMASDLSAAERFTKKIKNCIVRDLNTDNIVLVKKEN